MVNYCIFAKTGARPSTPRAPPSVQLPSASLTGDGAPGELGRLGDTANCAESLFSVLKKNTMVAQEKDSVDCYGV